jgi:hypothetical protein
MEDITRLPDITYLALDIKIKTHSIGASVFHVLRMCTGVRKVLFTLTGPTSHAEVILTFLCLSDTWYAFIFLGTPRLDPPLGVRLIPLVLDASLQIYFA